MRRERSARRRRGPTRIWTDPVFEDATCDVMTALGESCGECPDDAGPYCMETTSQLLNAPRIQVFGVLPETGDPLHGMIEVSAEQAELWRVAGLRDG